MYAVTLNGELVAKDFKTKPEAQEYVKFRNPQMRVINQNSKEFIKLDKRR